MNHTTLQQLNDEDFWKKLLSDPVARQQTTREDLAIFYTVYYLPLLSKRYDLAPFHLEIMDILQDARHKYFVLEGFRGSSKTSIANMVYTVWSIVGKQQAKFILIICQTQEQARICLTNIKNFMLSEPLHSDMGPFQVPDGEWRLSAIDIPKYGARVAVASIDQPVRGMLHNNVRPQVVILDDLENVNSARSADQREKLWNVVTSDFFPMGDIDTHFIIIGTRLHEQSVVMRLKGQIESGARPGIFRSYPIVDDKDTILWPGKYPDLSAVNRQKAEIGNEVAWQREFMLHILPDEYRVVRPEWIRREDCPAPTEANGFRGIYIGIDPAGSLSDGAAKTAMVVIRIFGSGNKLRLHVLPYPINERLNLPQLLAKAKTLADQNTVGSYRPKICVEHFGLQEGIADMLKEARYLAEAVRPPGDKFQRVALASPRIEDGTVRFALYGNEEIIHQLVDFKSETFKDLADAFSMLVLKIMSIYQGYVPFSHLYRNEPTSEKNGEYTSPYKVDISEEGPSGGRHYDPYLESRTGRKGITAGLYNKKF